MKRENEIIEFIPENKNAKYPNIRYKMIINQDFGINDDKIFIKTLKNEMNHLLI